MRFGRERRRQPQRSSGVLVAAITPRRDGEIEVDLAALFELLDFESDRGAGGIVLFGSTGEFVHYTPEERARVASLCVKRSRLPVYVNISHSTFEGTVFLAGAAADAGAAGLLAMPPYFFQYREEGIEAFFVALAGATAKLAPLFLYNIPFFTSPMSAGLMSRLLATGMFAGVKDSSGDWACFEQLNALRDTRDFLLYVGNDRIFARARQAGAAGVVSGVACAVPELLVAIDTAVIDGQSEKVARLDLRLQEYIDRVDALPAPVGIRETAALRGIRPGPHAAPLGDPGLRRVFELREWFPKWLAAVLEECKGA